MSVGTLTEENLKRIKADAIKNRLIELLETRFSEYNSNLSNLYKDYENNSSVKILDRIDNNMKDIELLYKELKNILLN